MDSSAYLMRHGWQGKGNSLHPSGRGIKKPLSVSRKANNFGIGKKKVDVQADQWWARAFDAGLEGLKLGTSKVSSDQNTSTSQRLGDLALVKVGARKWAGLFDGFVKGDGLEGTIVPSQGATHQSIPPKARLQSPPKAHSQPKRKSINEPIFPEPDMLESTEARPYSNGSSLQGDINTPGASSSLNPRQPTPENYPEAKRKRKTIGDHSVNNADDTNSENALPQSSAITEPRRKKRSKHRLKSSSTEFVPKPSTTGGSGTRKLPKEGRRRGKVKVQRWIQAGNL